MDDDFTFCIHPCEMKMCFRYPRNIRDKSIPHSYADMYASPGCIRRGQVETMKVRHADKGKEEQDADGA